MLTWVLCTSISYRNGRSLLFVMSVPYYELMSVSKFGIWDGVILWSASIPDSKVHGANMRTTWVLSAPGGSHIGPMNLAIRDPNTCYIYPSRHASLFLGVVTQTTIALTTQTRSYQCAIPSAVPAIPASRVTMDAVCAGLTSVMG